jgi:hypothetical protein
MGGDVRRNQRPKKILLFQQKRHKNQKELRIYRTYSRSARFNRLCFVKGNQNKCMNQLHLQQDSKLIVKDAINAQHIGRANLIS